MRNDPSGATAEGLPVAISRRAALRTFAGGAIAGFGAASVVIATAAPEHGNAAPLARIVGGGDRPELYASQKFTGPGWYVLGHEDEGSPRHVMWAFRDDHPFIALSDGEGLPVAVYASHRAFDRTCRGVLYPAPVGKVSSI